MNLSVRAAIVGALLLSTMPAVSMAAGCAKGAVAGGVGGLLLKHPVLGAAAGCAAGHYMAKKKDAEAKAREPKQPTDPNSGEVIAEPSRDAAPATPPPSGEPKAGEAKLARPV